MPYYALKQGKSKAPCRTQANIIVDRGNLPEGLQKYNITSKCIINEHIHFSLDCEMYLSYKFLYA